MIELLTNLDLFCHLEIYITTPMVIIGLCEKLD